MTKTIIEDPLLNRNDVLKMLGGVSVATFYRWQQDGEFPRPIKLTDHCARWKLSWVEEFVNRKDDSRGEVKPVEVVETALLAAQTKEEKTLRLFCRSRDLKLFKSKSIAQIEKYGQGWVQGAAGDLICQGSFEDMYAKVKGMK